METLSIILISLSTISIILAIIFEGKFKREGEQKISFSKELSILSPFAWILIGVAILTNIGNGLITHFNFKASADQIETDSKNYTNIINSQKELINQLKAKRYNDSIEINELKKETINVGLKSDSIKMAVVDNAIRTLNEERKKIERERENIFDHYQNEVQENLGKLLVIFQEKPLLGFINSDYFIATRLENTYIDKYGLITTNKIILEHLTEISELIKKINNYADITTKKTRSDSIGKGLNIRMILKNVEILRDKLYSIYGRIYNLESYKEYENFNFKKPLPNKVFLYDIILFDQFENDSLFYLYDENNQLILTIPIPGSREIMIYK